MYREATLFTIISSKIKTVDTLLFGIEVIGIKNS
jgi:hypothetical protein